MRRTIATLTLALSLVFCMAAGVHAQIPTPQDWPKNTLTAPANGAFRMCVFNVGPNTTTNGIDGLGANQLSIGGVRNNLEAWAAGYALDPLLLYIGRIFMKQPGETGHWVELLYSEYACRSFRAGTLVSVYTQIDRGGWREICFHDFQMNKDTTVMLTGNVASPKCAYSAGATLTR